MPRRTGQRHPGTQASQGTDIAPLEAAEIPATATRMPGYQGYRPPSVTPDRLAPQENPRLERLCTMPADPTASCDAIRIIPGTSGIELMQARFRGQPFAPHRHDTYAIGVTLAGVQRFRYRGVQWDCLPGQYHILHPDELHDGGAATPEGFGYRILYIDPTLIQAALGGRPLPFVATPVLDSRHRLDTQTATLWRSNALTDELASTELVAAAADLLVSTTATYSPGPTRIAMPGLCRVRSLLAECPSQRQPMTMLERLSGLDRWSLARQFRSAFGTSPSRFRMLRQLDHVRTLLRQGSTLADAALAAGFADQSHMSRKFRDTYGITPARWTAMLV